MTHHVTGSGTNLPRSDFFCSEFFHLFPDHQRSQLLTLYSPPVHPLFCVLRIHHRRNGLCFRCSGSGRPREEARGRFPVRSFRLRRCCLLLRHPRCFHSRRCVCYPALWNQLAVIILTDPSLNSVKTRIQLDPATYNRGMIGGFRQVIQNEGAGALLTGVGPTFAGYFLQGAFKFGGYEFFKKQSIEMLGLETARQNRALVYSASAASAEFFASIALCPLEATRIRLVSQPTFANGLISGFGKILKNEGVGAFYSGFGPILLKQ